MSQEKFDSKYNKNIKPRSRRRRSYREEKTRRSNKRSSYEVRRSPKRKRANPFKTSAYKKYKEFDLEDALVDYKQALEISPEDKEIHYYIASVYSLMEKKDKAYYHLQKSVELGLKQTNKILESDDFAFLRIQPDFEVFKDNGFRLSAANEAPEKNIPMDDLLLSQLNKLKEMRERGLLSEKEFLTEKEKIIRR